MSDRHDERARLEPNWTMGWLVLGLVVALHLLGVASVGGLGLGTVLAAIVYPSRPGAEVIY